MWTDYFTLAIRNLLRSRLRSILTMLGIFIGIAAVVSLVSLSQGLKGAIAGEFEKIGADKIFISAKGSQSGSLADISARQITLDDMSRVENVRGVKLVTGFLLQGSQVQSGTETGVFFASAIPDDTEERNLMIAIQSMQLSEGKLFRRNDEQQVVVGSSVAADGVFKKRIQVGSKILIKGREFRVGGIFKSTGDPGTDGSVWMSESVMRSLFDVPSLVNTIVVQTSVGEDPLVVAASIERSLRTFRGLEKGKEDFDIQTPEDILQTLNSILNVIQVVLVGIAAISLIVGGIGIMNTMYTSVLERTNEIGVMKAVGARNSDILMIFLIEAGFLGVVGGIIGILFGMAIAYSVKAGATIALGTQLIQVFFPWYLIVGVLLFAFVVGSASGVLPAYQASRLAPVEALRYE